jgi:hypothetical protein
MKRHAPYMLLTAILLAVVSLAWWWPGHRAAAVAAVSILPVDMPEFFRKGADTVGFHTHLPDMWTEFKELDLRNAERPEHFIDQELLKGRPIPRTRAEFFHLCRNIGDTPDWIGCLPYALMEWTDRLTVAFAEYRARPADPRVQAEVLFVAGILAHYATDTCQPLHTTVDFDGRINPDGSSPRTGIHLRMDAVVQNAGIEAASIHPSGPVKAADDVFALVLANIAASNALVDRVYTLDAKLPPVDQPFKGPVDPAVAALARERITAAATFTAELWYTAWVRSGAIVMPVWFAEMDR